MSILTESYTPANKSTLSPAKHREKGATQRFIVVVLNQECSYLNTPDLILPSQALFSVRTQLAVLSEVLDGTDHLRGVGVLVVVPGHDLNLIGIIVSTLFFTIFSEFLLKFQSTVIVPDKTVVVVYSSLFYLSSFTLYRILHNKSRVFCPYFHFYIQYWGIK